MIIKNIKKNDGVLVKKESYILQASSYGFCVSDVKALNINSAQEENCYIRRFNFR